jgi:iron complex transport system substrate-binding protein
MLLFSLWITLLATAAPVEDARGLLVKLAEPPKRIASYSVGSDEILLDLVGPERLIAVTSLAHDRRYSDRDFSKIKLKTDTDLELVIAAKPDLVVLATFNRREVVKKFSDFNIPTFVMGDFTSIAAVEKNIVDIGKLVHAQDRAKALVATMEEKIRALVPPKQTPTLLLVADGGFVPGKGTLFTAIAIAAGCQNIAENLVDGFNRVDRERLAQLKPDFLVLPGEDTSRPVADPLLEKMRLAGRAVAIPERYLSSISTSVADAAVALHSQITAKLDTQGKAIK